MPLLGAFLAVPEVRAVATLGEMGTVVALPVEWVRPGGVAP
jgi:hypothetical protein